MRFNAYILIKRTEYAGMAQLVEQLIRNEQVVGSSPTTSSKRDGRLLTVCFYEKTDKIRHGRFI